MKPNCYCSIMILTIVFQILFIHGVTAASTKPKCLTGSIKDVQSWVDDNGNIISFDSRKQLNTLDVSLTLNPADAVRSLMSSPTRREMEAVLFINMAKCGLRSVPAVFGLADQRGRHIHNSVEYITLFGNHFQDFGVGSQDYVVSINATGAREVSFREMYGRYAEAAWPVGFRNTTFQRLRELDLRQCSIQTIDDNIFSGMPLLEALYMGENSVFYISVQAFDGLKNLVHLDLSNNYVLGDDAEFSSLLWEFSNETKVPKSLVSLDFSYTKIARSTVQVLSRLGINFERLSLCYSSIRELSGYIFNGTSMRLLDVSGNYGILSTRNVLYGIENTLEVIYADEVGLQTLNVFKNFSNLKMIKAVNNQISLVEKETAMTFDSLEILALDNNRLTTWFDERFQPMQQLQLLSLRNNNINLIKPQMMKDISSIRYLGLSGNFFICNCHARDLYEIALRNDLAETVTEQPFKDIKQGKQKFRHYHTGYEYFNEITKNRQKINQFRRNVHLKPPDHKPPDHNMDSLDTGQELPGDFVLYDYDENVYRCLVAHSSETMSFDMESSCRMRNDASYEEIIQQSYRNLILILVIPTFFALCLFVGFYFRRSVKYFYITVRNSAMLSMIADGKEINEDTIFNYDVFVSYCKEDRPWVLDELLPQLEKNCKVSVCLHERDFQVGLSILENIVSCMDRSRCITLVISQRFLLSQWCQFEMHLAQHRLLETRREDLILVLLEDIPRRMRPNTLHYLMLSKTYVQWPADAGERPVFWRRMKKCIVTQHLRHVENVSLA